MMSNDLLMQMTYHWQFERKSILYIRIKKFFRKNHIFRFLTRGYAKRRNGFLWGLRYANVSLAHSGVESS